MAARDMLPVSEVLFLFFTGRGGSFLSQKEKEKNGGAKRADSVVRPYKIGSKRKRGPSGLEGPLFFYLFGRITARKRMGLSV